MPWHPTGARSSAQALWLHDVRRSLVEQALIVAGPERRDAVPEVCLVKDEMMSKELKEVAYPAWSEFLAFEKAYLQCLTDIAHARRGRPLVRQVEREGVVYVDAVPRKAGVYTREVCRCIDVGYALLWRGAVGTWLSQVRKLRLDATVRPVRRGLLVGEDGCGADDPGLAMWIKTREYQELERELRFFGEYAILSARFHWNTWTPCTTTKADVEGVAKLQVQLRSELDKLMADRYLRRHLSSQDLAAIPQLMKMLDGVRQSFEFVVREAPELHPFTRYHTEEGRGMRQAVAIELVDLCLLSFGQCPASMLEELLAGMGAELPSSLSKWLREQIKLGQAHLASQAQMRNFVNAALPLDQEDDPRRPAYPVLPWLDTSLGTVSPR